MPKKIKSDKPRVKADRAMIRSATDTKGKGYSHGETPRKPEHADREFVKGVNKEFTSKPTTKYEQNARVSTAVAKDYEKKAKTNVMGTAMGVGRKEKEAAKSYRDDAKSNMKKHKEFKRKHPDYYNPNI